MSRKNVVQQLAADCIVVGVDKARDDLREVQSLVEAYGRNNKRPVLVKRFEKAQELLRQIACSMQKSGRKLSV